MNIYFLIFLEFCKIGVLAFGGGLVTIPFLLDLSETYQWFTKGQIAEMIAISQSIPGPIGNNVAMFAGYTTAGFWGGVMAIFGLTIPAYLIISIFSKYIEKYYNTKIVQNLLFGMRAASVALILTAAIEITKISVLDLKSAIMLVASFLFIQFVRTNIFVYLVVSATIGIIFKL